MLIDGLSTAYRRFRVATITLSDVTEPVVEPQDPAAPADVDIDAIAGQLASAPVAFGSQNPINEQLGHDIADAIGRVDSANAGDLGSVGVVVLEHTPPHVPDVRDIAQDVANASGLDTVVVRTPHVAVGVSDTLSRAEVEQGQRAMVAEPDYARGLEAFAEASNAFSVPWVPVMIVIVAALILAAAFTFRSTR